MKDENPFDKIDYRSEEQMKRERALSGKSQTTGCADLPEGLSELRYHLKEALDSLNKFSGYNEAGKKYVVEATERSLDQAYKYLKYFQHNDHVEHDKKRN